MTKSLHFILNYNRYLLTRTFNFIYMHKCDDQETIK